jgi:sporulation protein YlmC with PRC-barrel domain
MIRLDQLSAVVGAPVVDADGVEIGRATQAYLDDQTGEPDWVTVGEPGGHPAPVFVPLRHAALDGDRLRVPYSRDVVTEAPRIPAEDHLDVEDEIQLYRHYGLEGLPPEDGTP